jgi:hypothetical protein
VQFWRRKVSKRLDDDWPVTVLGHFWDFDAASFNRTLEWISSRELADDRKVALARSFRTYAQNGRPAAWRLKLKKVVKGDAGLEAMLDRLLRPLVTAETRKWRASERSWEHRHRKRQETEARDRAEFVVRLKGNPDLVGSPPGLKPGEMSHDQYNLLRIVEGDGLRTDRGQGGNWQALIPEFGEEVAVAYRDAAIRHWREFVPGLRSEGAGSSSIPYGLIFAMAGLDIEAGDDGAGLVALSREEARLALRYSLWELNGYPRWLEPLYRAHSDLGHSLFWGETRWELENSSAERPLHYMLHDIVYHAPWLHKEMAPQIAAWLAEHDAPNDDCLRYSRHILVSGGTPAEALAALARTRTEAGTTPDAELPSWYALWVDSDPDAAIPRVEAKLNSVGKEPAARFAESFVLSLFGGRHEGGLGIGAFHTPAHLKRLYVLMHKHIRVADDINRVGKGVYSPTARDDAQDARGRLFSLLADIPGEATYREIIALASEHPELDYRAFMRRRARERAVADGDLEAWSTNQIREFVEGL